MSALHLNPVAGLTKPFSIADEAGRKQRSAPIIAIQQRGSIMWDIIISLIYHQSCKRCLADIRKHRPDLATAA
jgi:hypothetical protein